jgi:hypothetical protein
VTLKPVLSSRPSTRRALVAATLAALVAWGPAGVVGAQEPGASAPPGPDAGAPAQAPPPDGLPPGEPPDATPPPPPPPPILDPSPRVRVLLAHFGIFEAERVLAYEHALLAGRVNARATADARLEQAHAGVTEAQAALADAEKRFTDVAVEAFIFASGGEVPAVKDATLFERRQGEQLAVSVREHHETVVENARRALERADGLLARRQAGAERAARAVAEHEQRVQAADQRLVDARTELATAESEDVPTAFERDPGERWQLSIVGPSVFTPEELAEWFQQQGAESRAAAPITDLARFYIEEGEAEGVRGDMAFAQAVLETGSFSNQDTIKFNNYAGVGHCDSCPTGFHFESPQMGVRGQIQHVKSYAIRDAEFANPLVDKRLRGPAGCCQTWSQLTGVYATDPNYGPKILGIYQRMLEWLLLRRAQAAAVPAGPDPAPAEPAPLAPLPA